MTPVDIIFPYLFNKINTYKSSTLRRIAELKRRRKLARERDYAMKAVYSRINQSKSSGPSKGALSLQACESDPEFFSDAGSQSDGGAENVRAQDQAGLLSP